MRAGMFAEEPYDLLKTLRICLQIKKSPVEQVFVIGAHSHSEEPEANAKVLCYLRQTPSELTKILMQVMLHEVYINFKVYKSS